MHEHTALSDEALRSLIRSGNILFGGNAPLKIYGRLDCRAGKRMKRRNRVFFTTENEALALGFRPCGSCMKSQYLRWKMNLFYDAKINLLPCDGIVRYEGPILSTEMATYYVQLLLTTIAWRHDEAVIFGKHIITQRKVAWYGDEHYAYTYSNTTKTALPWTAELLALKALVEEKVGQKFNSCLLNLYQDGDQGMAWHSDDEKSLGRNTTIASLSLGAARNFSFRHKQSKETISLTLAHGSLLVMQGETQTHWLHALPKSKKVRHPRINLTFRTIIDA